MVSTTLRASAIDAVARSDKPGKNFGAINRLQVSAGSPQMIGHVQVSTPRVVGVVQSAVLRFTQAGLADAGNRTLSVRRITQTWREQRLTWKNRPTRVGTATDTAVVNGAGVNGRVVEFDVTDDVQAFVDGSAPNFGWTIESSNGNAIVFYSSEAAGTRGPTLVVTFSAQPEKPTDLDPVGAGVVAVDSPRLRWSFVDLGGDTTLAAIQVHLDTSPAGWTETAGFPSPDFDSGTVPATVPELDLAATAYAGAAAGVETWWTCRHADGSGLWSPWSDPESFVFETVPDVDLVYPDSGTVDDTTFPVAWDVADQARYQVLVHRLVDGTPAAVTWTTGPVDDAAAREVLVPRGIIPGPGVPHLVEVRVWDDVLRVDQPGAPGYASASQEISYDDTTEVPRVTLVETFPQTSQPGLRLRWRRAAAPDAFAIWVDGAETVVGAPADFPGPGGDYEHDLPDLAPQLEHTFEVKAIVDAVHGTGVDITRASADNATIEATVTPVAVWLIDPDDPGRSVRFHQEPGSDIVTTTMPEATSRFEPVGSSTVVEVTTALRGIEGALEGGILATHGELTAEELRTRMLAIKSDRLRAYTLVWGTHRLAVRLRNVNITYVDIPGAHRYRVSFEFSAAAPSTEYALL